MLQRVCDEGFFDSASALTLEEVRRELCGIVKFLAGMARRKIIYTSLSDPVTSVKYGVTVMPEEDFADYKLKVNRYLADFSDRDPTAYDFPLPLRAVYDYRPTRTPAVYNLASRLRCRVRLSPRQTPAVYIFRSFLYTARGHTDKNRTRHWPRARSARRLGHPAQAALRHLLFEQEPSRIRSRIRSRTRANSSMLFLR